MILTGKEIQSERESRRITIEPFCENRLEPNSYGVSLGSKILHLRPFIAIDRASPEHRQIDLEPSGILLLPYNTYLGHTAEVVGSTAFAMSLHARFSTAALGVWIHFSAPLGHRGAVIAWTLEIRVAHEILLYPGMPIGKVAFWHTSGKPEGYSGKYRDSNGPEGSKWFWESAD